MPLKDIGQEEIDVAAVALYPTCAPSTRNRQVYTPVSAILKRAGFKDTIDRPFGAAGNKATGWLWPEQAEVLFEEAGKLDPEFRLLCLTLLYAGGLRLSEGLGLLTDDCRLSENFAYLPDSKNDEPRPLFLPPFLVAELANHPRGVDRPGERMFRFSKGGHIYSLLKTAAFKAGVELPLRQAFHIFCHTYGTWMRRYASLDELGLLKLNRWKDRKSVERYTHVVVNEEAKRAELLPVPRPKRA
jgi:integrase